MLIRNLLDNAVRYCPAQGKIRLALKETDEHILLAISNSSKPLPGYVADALFEKFVRGPEETETGSGLGLSIVKRVVELHNGEIELQHGDEVDGVRIEIALPRSGVS